MSTDVREKVQASPVAEEKPQEGLINASGHKQEVERNFSLLSICAIAVTTGNTWIAQGGSVATALSNGGLAGTIYEFIAVSICYWMVAASLAELASGMPSASGVYHWSSITAGKYGRVCGFFAGWWNCLAWIFGAASMSLIMAQQTVSMYSLTHPEFMPSTWNVFLSFILCTWTACCIVLFMNRFLPYIGNLGMFFILAGVFVTIVVCAVMPHVNGQPYQSNEAVWKTWTNGTSYTQQGFVFVMGMLNGAYSVGTPDCSSHLAEEIPQPSRNIPKAILAQMGVGFITGILYMIAIFYAIQDVNSLSLDRFIMFPLPAIYSQATGSDAGGLGLLVVAFIPTLITATGCYITAGRTLWTISRDRATPFPNWLGHINTRFQNPFNATLVCGGCITILACIYMGSTTAFSAFVGCFVQLSSLSYFMAIFPHILTRRSSFVPGFFFMNNRIGYVINTLACIYIIAFVVIFCFPFTLPTDAASMNYASLMTGGLTIFVGIWWFVRQGSYEGPKNIPLTDKILVENN